MSFDNNFLQQNSVGSWWQFTALPTRKTLSNGSNKFQAWVTVFPATCKHFCFLAEDVGNAAAFLVSPLASSITGTTLYVDNGLHVMGLAVDSAQIAKAGAK